MIISSLLFAAIVLTDTQTNMCPITTTAELNDFRSGEKPELRVLDLVAHVTSLGNAEQSGFRTLTVEDETGRAELVYYGDDIGLGEVVRFRGLTRLNRRLLSWDYPTKSAVVGKKSLPAPVTIRIGELDAKRDDLRPIVVEGVVVSDFDDELDARFRIVILRDGPKTVAAYIHRGMLPDSGIGPESKLRLTGVFHRRINSWRLFQQPAIVCEHVEVLTPPPADPFAVPSLRRRDITSGVEGLAALGRRKIHGRALAVWNGNRLMLRIDGDDICFVRLRDGTEPPTTDTAVCVAGEISSDFFSLRIDDAVWKPAEEPADAAAEEHPTDVRPADVFRKSTTGRDNIDLSLLGSLIRISGTLISLPSPGRESRVMIVSSDGQTVPVDVSALPDGSPELVVGSRISVTGRCLLESSGGTSAIDFPRITGFTVIVRSPEDIKVISKPSWWTPTRLIGVIAALLAVILGFAVWVRFLNRLVRRRSFELSRAEIARKSSELRVAERTRIAVELHDSLSQNLTGIALAVNAGAYDLAKKSLKSCRDELRNCLLDLRNDALEASDMDTAIRKSLAPHVRAVKLSVRFSLARNKLSDDDAYTILRIVRELAVNAIRHGQATELHIAGSVEAKRILFSVRDNGSGFDPQNTPGMAEGHFGLEGIRDRIKNRDGEMKIESAPGKGTKVSIWIKSKY